jgi:predicted P-loop ATPase
MKTTTKLQGETVRERIESIYDKIFPVDPNTKRPLTPHGFKDASIDSAQWEAWEKDYPGCSWGFPTSHKIFVIDVDKKSGGLETWQELIEKNAQPSTRTVQTKNGGLHIYFLAPVGMEVFNSASKFGKGIDTRGEGGYVVIPPSQGYALVNDVEVSIAPTWIVERLLAMNSPLGADAHSNTEKFVLPETISNGKRNDTMFRYGASLRAKGMDDTTIRTFITQTNQSACNPPLDEEELEVVIKQVLRYEKGTDKASRNATPADYRKAMLDMGYSFSMHELDDEIYVNDRPMSDTVELRILYRLGNAGYSSKEKTRQAFTEEASEHPFHPVRDYLNGLAWDGKDHIGKLASYFTDDEQVFGVWLRKWLIGAVAKVLVTPNGSQNRTLVLVGGQKAGKSYFVRWLGSVLPEYYIEKGIDPTNKDDKIRRATKWIWEVGELGAVTRKADREALKTFQSEETVTERKAFGHHDMHKPALANYIGTINDEGTGFLNDPTGSRRYMACTIKKIDWTYSQQVSVDQVWAQAIALLGQGEDWKLSYEEEQSANGVNQKYEMENPLEQYINRYFVVDAGNRDEVMPTSEILDILKERHAISDTGRANQMYVSQYLSHIGLEKRKMTPRGYSKQVWSWIGIRKNSENYEIWL